MDNLTKSGDREHLAKPKAKLGRAHRVGSRASVRRCVGGRL